MRKRVQRLVSALNGEHAHLFSPWERGFIDSVERQLSSRAQHILSDKQVEVIQRAEAKLEKALTGDPAWEKEWNEHREWEWKTAVEYYRNQPERYFYQIVNWQEENPNKQPSRDYFKKVVENKYAQKIIKGLGDKPKYAAGEAVLIRTTARRPTAIDWWQWSEICLLNTPFFVIEPTSRAVSAVNGCRIYVLLSSMSAATFELEERYIKKFRKYKKGKTTQQRYPFLILTNIKKKIIIYL